MTRGWMNKRQDIPPLLTNLVGWLLWETETTAGGPVSGSKFDIITRTHTLARKDRCETTRKKWGISEEKQTKKGEIRPREGELACWRTGPGRELLRYLSSKRRLSSLKSQMAAGSPPPTAHIALCSSCQATPVCAPLSRRLQVNPWHSGLASPLLRTNSGDGAFLI